MKEELHPPAQKCLPCRRRTHPGPCCPGCSCCFLSQRWDRAWRCTPPLPPACTNSTSARPTSPHLSAVAYRRRQQRSAPWQQQSVPRGPPPPAAAVSTERRLVGRPARWRRGSTVGPVGRIGRCGCRAGRRVIATTPSDPYQPQVAGCVRARQPCTAATRWRAGGQVAGRQAAGMRAHARVGGGRMSVAHPPQPAPSRPQQSCLPTSPPPPPPRGT